MQFQKNEIKIMQDIVRAGTSMPFSATTLAQSNLEIPIICLSDDEPTTTNVVAALPKAEKKHSIIDTSSGESGEKPFRRRKRRKINAEGAPKMPLTGYVRFMNHRRESLRKEHPSKSAIEHTKMIGEEWHQLPENLRAPFMQAAEVDKKRYANELSTFLKENPDALSSELTKNKTHKNNIGADCSGAEKKVLKDKSQQLNRNAGANITNEFINETKPISVRGSSSSDTNISPPPVKPKPTLTSQANNFQNTATAAGCIPGAIAIFTNDFLEHNKKFDMDLRTLRKSRTDIEQKTALLEKHVENLQFGVNRLEAENNDLEEKTLLLETYVNKLKWKLVCAFSTLPIPTEPSGATYENIFKYMDDLSMMAISNTHEMESLNKAKDIIRDLDMQIQL